ncbi:hypothetical protein FHG87_018813 [Trinorchestia longiramus]|nr:hypothetical protein FHG87_018813 [Trinorchestia longiramus]
MILHHVPQETKNEYGALMYIIFVMVLFAAPMIALIVRYLWGERESSRMEAFYSRMMENKPPRMILYDYNGRRLTKPELQRPNPVRKLTYHGIPYQEGYYNPASYCYRTSSIRTDNSGAVHGNCTNGKPPTIYLSENKWRRWFASLSSTSSPDSPKSKYPFTQATSPGTSDIYLTSSTPQSESSFSVPFHLKPIVMWRNRSGLDTSDTQPTLRLLPRIKRFSKENSAKSVHEEEQKAFRESEETYNSEMICNLAQSTRSHQNEPSELDQFEQEKLPNVRVLQRKRAIIPGAAYRQLEEPNRLLESNIDCCRSSSLCEYCQERHTSCTLSVFCKGKNYVETNYNIARPSLPEIILHRENRYHLSNDSALTTMGQPESSNFASVRRTRKASDL